PGCDAPRGEDLREDGAHSDPREEVADARLVEVELADQKQPEERDDTAEPRVEEERRQEDRPELGLRIGAGDVRDALEELHREMSNVLVGLFELEQDLRRVRR